jgi:predicted metalloprotease with PDZ domain
MLALVLLAALKAQAPVDPNVATYHVKMLGLMPPRLAVTAELPIDGKELMMDTTRPGGVPELDRGGWPSFVSKLKVTDDTGADLDPASAAEAGWLLGEAHTGRLKVSYELNFLPLAARGWPAPREAVLADEGDLVLVGRALFVTTKAVTTSRVDFELPGGWKPVTPWQPVKGSSRQFAIDTAGDLVENLLVLTKTGAEVVQAGGLRLYVTTLGHWKKARSEVRRVLGSVVPRLVGLMPTDDHDSYLVVLLPVVEHGGESYRHSFALTLEEPPTHANSPVWGNTIAHEIFHLWNGWKLVGADYPTSQWFQEGFTEYAANVSMVAGKLTTQEQFQQVLAAHITKAKTLTATLEAAGSHKGPPLYSAGALVALTWDVRIRQATGNKSSLWTFMNALYQQTDRGKKHYAWTDIQAALTATAPGDWDEFHTSYIQGKDPLPLDQTFAWAGLELATAKNGAPYLKADAKAPAASKTLWHGVMSGR